MFNQLGLIKEDVIFQSLAITPIINTVGSTGSYEKMGYQTFFRSFESLQDFVGDDRVEARARARYVSETVYNAADYSITSGPKFKKELNKNLEDMGIIAGQKGAQTTVEHATPRSVLWKSLIDLAKTKELTVEEVAAYIMDHNEIVVLTYEESKILDSRYKTSSPDWNDKFSRYKAMGITIVDSQTGKKVI